MNYKRGDVILVVFRPPISGQKRATKSRPMLVISSDVYHSDRPQDVSAALITTKTTKYQGTTDYQLQDWQNAGLYSPSVVRCTLATIEQNQISGKIGTLTSQDLHGVETSLRQAVKL